MEEWDVYNRRRELTKKTAIRDKTQLQPGEFHVVCKFAVINPEGKVLLTQRAEHKQFGLYWECGGGSIKKGEKSLEGTIREAEEEVGFTPDKEKAFLLESQTYRECFVDIWVFPQDVKDNEITFPDGESIASKWVTIDEFEQMKKNNTYSPVDIFSRRLYDEAIKMINLMYPDYLKNKE